MAMKKTVILLVLLITISWISSMGMVLYKESYQDNVLVDIMPVPGFASSIIVNGNEFTVKLEVEKINGSEFPAICKANVSAIYLVGNKTLIQTVVIDENAKWHFKNGNSPVLFSLYIIECRGVRKAWLSVSR